MAKRASSSLSNLSSSELHAELNRRGKMAGKLQRKRAKLLERLAEIDAEIRAHGGSLGGVGPGRVRAKNDTNLVGALKSALDGKTMSVTDVAEAVQKQGYITTSPNFRTIVNQALIKNTSVFKKVSRGQYTAK